MGGPRSGSGKTFWQSQVELSLNGRIEVRLAGQWETFCAKAAE